MKRAALVFGLGLVLVLVMAACSSGEASSEGDVPDDVATTSTTSAASPADTVASNDDTVTTVNDAGSGEPAAAPPSAGSATLTVGDQTWTFDNYYCRTGPENTGNDRVSFSSGAFGTHEGVRTQLDASIQDTDQQGRLEGEGTIQSVTLNDIEDFENPSIALSAVSGFVGSPEFVIQVNGDQVTAEAFFDDDTTDEIEAIPGTLEATCGAG